MDALIENKNEVVKILQEINAAQFADDILTPKGSGSDVQRFNSLLTQFFVNFTLAKGANFPFSSPSMFHCQVSCSLLYKNIV